MLTHIGHFRLGTHPHYPIGEFFFFSELAFDVLLSSVELLRFLDKKVTAYWAPTRFNIWFYTLFFEDQTFHILL